MTTQPDAYWCGRFSETLREISRIAATSPEECKRLADAIVADYEVNSGFPPPDAQIRAHVGEDMPLDYLKPGERLINGTIYYSARWLDEGVVEVPGAYRYVIFLNEGKTKMLTCWPQENGTWWKLEEATRPWTDGTWGPPTCFTYRGSVEKLEHYARDRRGLPVKELVL